MYHKIVGEKPQKTCFLRKLPQIFHKRMSEGQFMCKIHIEKKYSSKSIKKYCW